MRNPTIQEMLDLQTIGFELKPLDTVLGNNINDGSIKDIDKLREIFKEKYVVEGTKDNLVISKYSEMYTLDYLYESKILKTRCETQA